MERKRITFHNKNTLISKYCDQTEPKAAFHWENCKKIQNLKKEKTKTVNNICNKLLNVQLLETFCLQRIPNWKLNYFLNGNAKE